MRRPYRRRARLSARTLVLGLALLPLWLPALTPVAGAAPGTTDPARLSAALDRLRHTKAVAVQAAADISAELAQLSAAQTVAAQQLADTLAMLQKQRAANSDHVRELYVSGGDLPMLGELLLGGRPEDLFDRAQVVTAVASSNTVSTRAAEAATREAADLAASVAVLADQQITLAVKAGQRAAALTDAVTKLAAELATAQRAARVAAEQRAARVAARDAAHAAAIRLAAQATEFRRAATLATELSDVRAAAASVFRWAQQAGSTGSRFVPAGTVPTAYRAAVSAAGTRCPPTLTPALLAAQLATESRWNPLAVSSSGAQGLAQFLPGTWAAHGIDGDGDGRAQAFDPLDAIASAAAYDCSVARIVGQVSGDPVDTMLAAYNAGPGAVLAAGGVPPDPVVIRYVSQIRQAAPGYGTASGSLR